MRDDEWRMPLELSQPLPRAFEHNGSWRMTVWFGVSLSLLPIIIICPVVLPIVLKMDSLKESGLIAEGQIYDRAMNVRNGHKSYVVAYRFFVPGGPKSDVGISGVSEFQYSALPLGSRVKVLYQANEPDNSALSTEIQTSWSHPWLTFTANVAVAIGISTFIATIFFGYAGFRLFKERRLIKWGTATSAQIVGEDEVRDRAGSSIRLTYRYEDDHGNLQYGTRGALPTGQVGPLEAATVMFSLKTNPTVLYDPKDPTVSLLYPPFFLNASSRPRHLIDGV